MEMLSKTDRPMRNEKYGSIHDSREEQMPTRPRGSPPASGSNGPMLEGSNAQSCGTWRHIAVSLNDQGSKTRYGLDYATTDHRG